MINMSSGQSPLRHTVRRGRGSWLGPDIRHCDCSNMGSLTALLRGRKSWILCSHFISHEAPQSATVLWSFTQCSQSTTDYRTEIQEIVSLKKAHLSLRTRSLLIRTLNVTVFHQSRLPSTKIFSHKQTLKMLGKKICSSDVPSMLPLFQRKSV